MGLIGNFWLRWKAFISDVIKLAQRESDVTSSYTWVFALKAKQVATAQTLKVIDISRKPELSWRALSDFPRINMDRAHLSANGQRMMLRAIDELEERFAEPANHEMIAMMLDPRTKDLRFLANESWKRDGKQYLTSAFQVLAEKFSQSDTSQTYIIPDRESTDDFFVVDVGNDNATTEIDNWLALKINWREWADPKRPLPTSERITVIDLFHSVNCCDFWRAHAPRFRILSVLARIYLGLPSAQSFQERLFSTANNVMGDRRTGLDPHVFKQLC